MAAIIAETKNPEYGFWGTSLKNGYDADLVWRAASQTIASAFNLPPAKVRDLLDSTTGRHLADDLSLIPGGPTDEQAIADHLRARFRNGSFKRWMVSAIKSADAE